MDRKPNVMITTYTSNLYKKLNYQANNSSQDMPEATKAEISTDFFDRCKRLQARNKILTDLSQIRGPSGSIRGHKDVVRRSLEGIKIVNRRQCFASPTQLSTFASSTPVSSIMSSSFSGSATSSLDGYKAISWQMMDELYCNEMLERLSEDEQNLCVIYTTTLGVIRRTFEDSKSMRAILDLNLINFEERDIYLNQEYKNQLKLRCKSIKVPAIFVDGKYIGGIKELDAMNENKELIKLLARFKLSKASKNNCKCCGNAKFIACPSCNGSRKSTIHHFKFNSVALRCIKCDKNDGLVQCPVCYNDNYDDHQNEYFNLQMEHEQRQQSSQLNNAQVLTDVDNNIIANLGYDIYNIRDKIDNHLRGKSALIKWNDRVDTFTLYKSQQPHRAYRKTNQ